MIVEFLQVLDFARTGTLRGLMLFFSGNVLYLHTAHYFSQKYRPWREPFEGKVSVIIATWNEKVEWLRRAVRSTIEAGADEVIVCYSRSDRRAIEALEGMEGITHVVSDARVSKKRAVYEGIKTASGDIVCILDSDTFVTPTTITEISKPFMDESMGGVVAHNIIFNDKHLAGLLSSIQENGRNLLNTAFSYFGQVHVLDSRFCAYRRQAVLPLLDQYLSHSFMGKDVVIGEDKVMTALLQKKGWKCVIQETAVDYTAAPDDLAGFLKQQLRWTRSGWLSFFRHWWCLTLHPLLTFHIMWYFLSPLIFPFVLCYDYFLAPPLPQALPHLLIPLVIVSGVSLITAYRAKAWGIRIPLRNLPVVGVLGLTVLWPLMLYALATIWKQRSWLSR